MVDEIIVKCHEKIIKQPSIISLSYIHHLITSLPSLSTSKYEMNEIVDCETDEMVNCETDIGDEMVSYEMVSCETDGKDGKF